MMDLAIYRDVQIQLLIIITHPQTLMMDRAPTVYRDVWIQVLIIITLPQPLMMDRALTAYLDVQIPVLIIITLPQPLMMDRAPIEMSKSIEQSAKGKLYSLRDSSAA